VESKAQLQRMIHETPAGRIVTLELSRDGQPVTVKVELGQRNKAWSPKAKDFHFEIPPIPNMPDIDVPMNIVVVHSSLRSGLAVENLTPQLGEFFGVKNGKGVLIRSVEKGSQADKAGFHAGDVIIRVAGQFIHDTSDFTHAMPHGGGSVNVNVIRDKKEQTLTLTLPGHKDSGEMLQDESLDDEPLIDAKTYLKLSTVQDEIAKYRPQMEFAIQEDARKASEDARRSMEEARKSLCSEQREMRKQAEKMRKEITPRLQQELKKEQKELQKQMQQLRLQVQGWGLDI
jgi:hypothetical protein